MYNGLTNEITFHHKKKKFVLHPLPPSKVFEDQLQMRKLRDEESMHKELGEKASNTRIHEVGKSNALIQVTQRENNLFNKALKKTLLCEQPSYLLFCK